MPGTQCTAGLFSKAPGKSPSRAHKRARSSAWRADSLAITVAGQLAGGAKADDLVDRQRAGAQATLVPAAEHERLQCDAARCLHEQRADPLGPIELVGGERQQVDAHRDHVDRQFAGALRRIDVQRRAVRPAQGAEGRDVLHRAGLIVGVHERDQHGLGAQRLAQLFGKNAAFRRRTQVGDRDTFALELAAGIEHRLVLGARRDHVHRRSAARRARAAHRAQNGQIVGLGGARR